MRNSESFKEYLQYLQKNLNLLPDKPEETFESTLSALWLLASGQAVSAEAAILRSLPELNDSQKERLNDLISTRLQGTPLAHITGRQQFMGVELLSDSKALIPRKETEILGNSILKILKGIPVSQEETLAFDLCCGAGNLAVALAVHSPDVRFFASDLSAEAVELAKKNVSFHNLKHRIKISPGSVFEAFESDKFYEKIDIVICNPPYISDSKVPKMTKEIAEHEPDLAFKGGMLGINIIRELIRNAPRFLKNGGWLAFEVGLGQGDFVQQLCTKTLLYQKIKSVSDERGNIRVIIAQK